jgi:arginase
MSRPLRLIGAPSSAGAYAPGQEKAPAAFRRHGLVETLARRRTATDWGDVPGFRWRPDPTRPKAANLPAVHDTAAAVAGAAANAFTGDEAVLVLGGDCTVELGTVAGAARDGASLGLIYVDLDLDLNAPGTSDGALDWTGVAHLLDIPGAAPELSGMGPRRPLLPPDAVLFFAADNVSPPEAETAERLGLARLRLDEVKADPAGAAARAVAWGARFDRLLVHLDVDVLDYLDFPVAENVRRCPALTFAQLSAALPVLLAAPNWRGLTVAEVNPEHAPDEAQAFAALAGLLDNALPAS